MYASKENAARARNTIYVIRYAASAMFARDHSDDFNFIIEFLNAAEKKLPSEAAFLRDAKRKHRSTKNRGRRGDEQWLKKQA